MNTNDQLLPHRWQRLQTLYDEAMTLATSHRPQFVIDSCAEDKLLRDQLLSLVMQSDDGRSEVATGFAKRSPTTLETGHVIGRYRILRQLGVGGMGSVYLAERADSEFQQQVAIKLVNSNLVSPNVIARMRGERQILANLNHPNIARLIDGGATSEGLPYLVMEYVEGTRIDLYCSTNNLDINDKLQLFKQVCSAVHAAHQQLIIHRDIKPSNILVTSDGVPKLLDFGIAKLLDASTRISDTALTLVNERMLTPEYASPEQVRGEPLSTASDVYALGILLYELLTGTRPYRFKGTTLHQLEQFMQSHTPLKPSVVIEQLPVSIERSVDSTLSRSLRGDLDNIIMKAMHKDTMRRYGSASALADDIDNYLSSRPISARPDTMSYLAVKFWRRNRWAVTSAAIMFLLIIALTIFYTWRLTTERNIAQREKLTATRVSNFMTEVFRVANPNESRGNTVAAREILDNAVMRIDRDLRNEPGVQVALLRKMAQAYVGIGLWENAKQLLSRAVLLQQHASGKQQLDLADTLTELGQVQTRLSDIRGEWDSLERALDIRNSLHQDRTVAALPLLIAWAKNQSLRGNDTSAMKTLDDAEAIAASSPETSKLMLGNLHFARGEILIDANRYKEAEAAYRKAQPLLHGLLDEGSDPYLENALSLGYAMILEVHLDEAREYLRSVLNELTPRYPANHPLIASVWNELGIAYCDSGLYAEGSSAFGKSVDMEQHLSANPLRVAMMYGNLGSAYRDAGNLHDALASLDKAINMMISASDDKNVNLKGLYYEQAATHRLLGNLSAAEKSLQAGERLLALSDDMTDPNRYFVQLERGRWLTAKGKAALAVTKLQSTLDETPKEAKRLLANVYLALGEALDHTGKCEEAIRQIRTAYDIRKTVFPATNWYIYEAESSLGNTLSKCGHTDEAQPLLTNSVEKLRQQRPKNDISLTMAERNLAAHEQRIKK